MQNIEDSGKKGKDIIDSFGDALASNFSVAAVSKVVQELDNASSLLLRQFGIPFLSKAFKSPY